MDGGEEDVGVAGPGPPGIRMGGLKEVVVVVGGEPGMGVAVGVAVWLCGMGALHKWEVQQYRTCMGRGRTEEEK
jgi:hypothetical protein